MKTKFTKQYIVDNKGCYSINRVEDIKCINNKTITLKELFRDLPIKDFSWFLVRKCELTTRQKQLFAIHCAEQVLPIFEKSYPNDTRVRECIEAAKLFLDGKINRDELLNRKRAAAVAADAAVAAYAAAAAAVAAAAYADDAAAYDAYYAYVADDAAAYSSLIWKFIETIKSKEDEN